MNRIFYIVKKFDERIVQGIQIAFIQSFQLLPGLLSFHMTGSIHRHILVGLLAGLVCVFFASFIDHGALPSVHQSNELIGIEASFFVSKLTGAEGVLRILTLGLSATLMLGYLWALIKKGGNFVRPILSILFAFVLAIATIAANNVAIVAFVQMIFIFMMLWERIGSLGAGHHRDLVRQISSQMISFFLLLTSCAFQDSGGVANVTLLVALALRGGVYPFHNWIGASSDRSISSEGVTALYQVSIWSFLIAQVVNVKGLINHSFFALSTFMVFGLVVLIAESRSGEGSKKSFSAFLPIPITAVVLISLLRSAS